MGKRRVKMPSATSIVARSYPDRIIGVENRLPWHLGTDLRKFKEKTSDHAIIMGRKTFESIGRPLPNRLNIVLSKSKSDEFNTNVKIVNDRETALLEADVYSIINDKKEFFIIGGEIIYELFSQFINKIFITDVFCGNINGDAKFDKDFDNSDWWFPYEEEFPRGPIDDHDFRISCVIRKKSVHRYRSKVDFMHHEPVVLDLLDSYPRIGKTSSSPGGRTGQAT